MSTPPTSSGRDSRFRRWAKYLAVALLGLLGLVVLFLLGMALKGRYDLVAIQKQLRAQGEELTLAELAPVPIPDAENFFADPMWRELADLVPSREYPGQWTPRLPQGERQLDALKRTLTAEEQAKLTGEFPEFAPQLAESPNLGVARKVWKAAAKSSTDSTEERQRAAEFVLAVQSTAQPLISRVRELLERGDASFVLDQKLVAALQPEHLHYLLTLGRFFSQRAQAHLALGQTDSAREEILTVFKLSDTLATEPLLISFLVRGGLLSLALSPVDEGIQHHVWTAKDLAWFESLLAPIDLQSWLAQALRGERARFNQGMERMRSPSAPSDSPKVPALLPARGATGSVLWGFLLVTGPGDEAAANRIMQSAIDATLAEPTISPQWVANWEDPFEQRSKLWRYTHIFTTLTLPVFGAIFSQAAWLQTEVDQTRIACALERFRLAHGSYPETLDTLVPQFLPQLLPDQITGQPLSYRRQPDGSFLLWSVGWNETDEAGVPGKTKSEGDWVWGGSGCGK